MGDDPLSPGSLLLLFGILIPTLYIYTLTFKGFASQKRGRKTEREREGEKGKKEENPARR
jgi:hypothetical protein